MFKKTIDIEKSIVHILCDHSVVSYVQPWSAAKKYNTTGTGFCLKLGDKQKYIMTNAHCVCNASNIEIRKRGNASSYKGKIVNIVFECDLAMLSIDAEFYEKSKHRKDAVKIINEFWEDITPLEIAGLPSKLDTIYV